MTGPGHPAALAALAAGAAVVLTLIAQRAGLPLDLLDLTLVGLALAVLCGFAVGLTGGLDRRLASLGLALAVLPALVLAYELTIGTG